MKKPSASHGSMAASVDTGVKVRTDNSGNPVQNPQLGTCKLPGCDYPRRVEKGVAYDFCSQTCSRKFDIMSSNSGKPFYCLVNVTTLLSSLGTLQVKNKSLTNHHYHHNLHFESVSVVVIMSFPAMF